MRSLETETRLFVTCCHQFVVGFGRDRSRCLGQVHPLSVVLSATLNLETGLICSNIWLSTFVTFPRMDLGQHGTSASQRWWPRKGKAVAVRQAVAEGGSKREVLRRLVEVLATLLLVNAAEWRELTATVFETYLVPCAEPVTGRFYHEAAGAIKDRPRQNAQRLTNSSVLVRARMGGVSSQLGCNERVGARARGDGENLLGGRRGEELPSTTGGTRAALQGEVVHEDRWQRGVDAHRVLPRPYNTPARALEAALLLQKRIWKQGLAPRGPLEREASKLLAQMRGKKSAWPADWSRSVSVWLTFCAGGCWIRRWHTLS